MILLILHSDYSCGDPKRGSVKVFCLSKEGGGDEVMQFLPLLFLWHNFGYIGQTVSMKKITYLFMLMASMALAQERATIQLSPKPAPQTAVTPATLPTATATFSPTAPEITFTETTHDFGSLKKGSPVVYKFQYKNTGKEALILFNCKAGCSCTTPKCSKEPLKSGKSDFIEVHYDSMRVGNFSKEVIVTSNAKNGYVNLVIKGVVVGEVEGTDKTVPVKNEEKMKATENKHQ